MVALLRGINVGFTTKVAMAVLRTAFAEATATDIVTVLNSGNVVYTGNVPSQRSRNRSPARPG